MDRTGVLTRASIAARGSQGERYQSDAGRFNPWVWLVSAAFCQIVGGCTPIGKSSHVDELRVNITADDEARPTLDDVEVLVESQAPGSGSWNLETSRRYPTQMTGWPLAFSVKGYLPATFYQVTATARDDAGAITAQARAFKDPAVNASNELWLRFDHECVRRSELCLRTQTCSLGDCVDAHDPLRDRPSADDPQTTQPGSQTSPVIASGESMDAQVSQPCSADGARTCALMTDTQPLTCQQGMWQAEPACPDTMRCDTSTADTHGMCQPIATECTSRDTGDLYCDANGLMRECQANQTAKVNPCGDNEHCAEVDHVVRCTCLTGFVTSAQGCVAALNCTDRGGCDPETMCQMQNNMRACTACPAGFSGTGEAGCAALLTGLQVAPGQLDPPFSPTVKQYSVRLPVVAQRLSVTASTSVPAAELSVNNMPAALDKPWMSDLLPPGTTTIPVTLRARSGLPNDYKIAVERSDALQDYLKASNGHTGDAFGARVAAYGDTVVVGAPFEQGASASPDDSGTTSNAGAAYVFVRAGDRWVQQGYLKSSEITQDDLFGASVSIWGDRIAVGALGHNIFTALGTGTRDGTVHVFVRKIDHWELQQVVVSKNAVQSGDGFGLDVVLREDSMVVGAPLEDDGGVRSGAAYYFKWNGTQWEQQQRFKATTPTPETRFGSALAFDEDTLVVGAQQEEVNSISRAGAAYAYTWDGSNWTLLQRLVAPTPQRLAQFGYSLAVLGDTLVASAPANTLDTTSPRSGEVHVFKRTGAELRPVERLESTHPAAGDYFGYSVALNSTMLLVGSSGDPSTATSASNDGRPAVGGTAYLYARTPGGSVRSAFLKASNADAGDGFGRSVAMTETTLVVAAPDEDSVGRGVGQSATDNSLSDSGAVYLFR
jgi:hypothetical protein